MRYCEFIEVAKKHLFSTMALLSAYENEGEAEYDLHVLMDLWYLSGYTLEAMTTYLVYKRGGWQEDSDIQYRYDREFTGRTGVDFYPNGKRCVRGVPLDTPLGNIYDIHSHHFQQIVKNIFNGDNAYDSLPYFGNTQPIDTNVEKLIDEWKPDIRYYYLGRDGISLDVLSQENIKKLVLTCYDIYSKINCVI